MVRRWVSSLRLAQAPPPERDASSTFESDREGLGENHLTPFDIRRAVPKDVKALAGLWREMMEFHRSLDPAFQFGTDAQASIERHLAETVRSGGGRVFLAEADGRIIGYILG